MGSNAGTAAAGLLVKAVGIFIAMGFILGATSWLLGGSLEAAGVPRAWIYWLAPLGGLAAAAAFLVLVVRDHRRST